MHEIGLVLTDLKPIRDAHLIPAIGIAPAALLLYVIGALIAP